MRETGRPRKTLAVSWSGLRVAALTYTLLPLLFFFLGWLRPSVSLVAVLLLALLWIWSVLPDGVVGLICAMARKPGAGNDFGDQSGARIVDYSAPVLLMFAVVAFTWVFFSGIGGYWAQSTDFTARNSIFASLVESSWPVYYDNGAAALVYYFNHWLPPAAVGKAALLVTGDVAAAQSIANFALLIWSAVGVLLVELLFSFALRASTLKNAAAALIIFVFFSGPDIVGIILRSLMGSVEVPAHAFGTMHLEQWASSSWVQYSGNTTLLFWVFNQTIIPWICTLCVLQEPTPKRFVPYGLGCFGAGPYSFFGLVIICVARGILMLLEKTDREERLALMRQALSLGNFLALALSVIYIFFFTGNHSVATSGDRMQLLGLAPGASLGLTIVFYLLEVGVFVVLLWKHHKREPLLWLSAGVLAVLPFIHFGSWYEVCYRVSIPFLLIICLLCARTLLGCSDKLMGLPVRETASVWLLIIWLVLGAVTPVFEFARGVVSVSRNGVEGSLQPATDIAGSTVEDGAQNNFKAPISDGSIFFTYLAEPYEEN